MTRSYTEDEIAHACMVAEICDGQCESLLIALQDARAKRPPAYSYTEGGLDATIEEARASHGHL
jgi:hypothetical protein